MRYLHAAFAALWMAVALTLAISTALLGNRHSALAAQRGADLKTRTDMIYHNDRLRAAIDWQSSPPVLSEAVRRLQLQLEPPVSMARVERSSP